MGVLDIAGGRNGEASEETASQETPEPAAEQQAESQRARAEDGTFVSAEALQPKPSRRNKTEELITSTLDARWKEYEGRASNERQQFQGTIEQMRQQLQQQAEANARLQGALDEMRSRPAHTAPQQQGPSADDLHREATKQLQAGNFDEWHRLERQALRIEAKQEAEGLIKPQLDAFKAEIQKQIPPNIPPYIQRLLMDHRHVALAGEDGAQAVTLERKSLDIYRRDLTPEQRLQMAFALADKKLAAMSQGPRSVGFDQSSAAALSGVPTGGRAPTNGGGGGVQLSGADLANAKKAGMTAEEWVKWSDPHKYGMVRD